MGKIAVQCKTEEEWNVVRGKLATRARWQDFVNGGHSDCIGSGGWSPRSWYEEQGFKIITAAEYLNEGGKDVKEFEVGDRVECTRPFTIDSCLIKGASYIVTDGGSNMIEIAEVRGQRLQANRFKLAGSATKPKTTKENNMKDNNIDSNVLATFGSKVNGDELVVIDRHFTDNMLKEILMETYSKEIQTACGVAEVKRLKEEAKK